MNPDDPEAQFVRLVAEAYEHLYDPVFLRTHPLTGLLVSDPALAPKERAWRVQKILLAAIDELDPGPKAPPFSLEARRHELLSLRYGEGLDPQTVADRLGISRRHFYREHQAAMEALASILRERCSNLAGAPHDPAAPPAQTSQIDRLALLRLEAARLAQSSRYAAVAEVLDGALALLEKRLLQRNVSIQMEKGDEIPEGIVDRNLLRQIFLAMLSCLVERMSGATLKITTKTGPNSLHLELRADPAHKAPSLSDAQVGECLAALDDLAKLAQVTLRPIQQGSLLAGFDLWLPAAPQRTVLVIDDNPDVCELIRRYLMSHGYRVAVAHSAAEARSQALALRPYAITLDLMMPDQDGWDLLQFLLNQPETRAIPIIVCSVLRARELALSLGATAFVAKPVTEKGLMEALQALEQR